jgi:outer membrane protein OmpA-like peptidoglycan-associated protein
MKKRGILIWLTVLLSVFGPGVFAQLRQTPDLQKADKLISEGKLKDALRLLNAELKENPGDPAVLYFTGKVYLAEHNTRLATLFLSQASEKTEGKIADVQLALADAYQKSHRFDLALEILQDLSVPPKSRPALLKKIQECRTGSAEKASPQEVKITNLGAKINTAANELHPLVSADFMQLFFTRSEGSETQIHQSFNKAGWESALPLESPVNSARGEQLAGISVDGQVLYFIRPDRKGDIFFSEFRDGRWSAPKSFPWNSPGQESSLSLSADGKLLFFVSDRQGSKDIFWCKKAGNSWSKPQRCAANINTKLDEESPWLDADGRYLYFSSQGHETMGGFDIFRVEWGRAGADPENIGYPINSATDDLYYMLLPDQKTAFYSSARDGGFGGEDIYSIRMQVGKPAQLSLFKGTISDQTGLPVDAQVLITETGSTQPIAKIKAHPETGTFVTMLPSGKAYSILLEREGYLFTSDLVDLKEPGSGAEMNRDYRLQKLIPGVTLVLSNVFFDPGKSSLRRESSQELMRILAILRQNPGLKVEISGHLDAGGPEDVLQKLSENRAQAVVDYLVATGIKSSRLVVKGYGSSKPIAENKTEYGRQQNRRTEFKILSSQ